jgi:hypothetical protein
VKIRTASGRKENILKEKRNNLFIANINLNKNTGGGLEICVLSIKIRSKSWLNFESIKYLHELTMPPIILELECGKAPTSKTEYFLLIKSL